MGRKALVNEKIFVEVWNAAASVDEVREVLFPEEDTPQRRLYCSMYATRLRKKGLDLKKFKKGRVKVEAPEAEVSPENGEVQTVAEISEVDISVESEDFPEEMELDEVVADNAVLEAAE